MKFFNIRKTFVGLVPHGEGYTVKDLGSTFAGYVDMLKKQLGVSMDATLPYTRWVQLHELSHIRWSRALPSRVAKAANVPVECVLAAEDARINTRLVRSVPDAYDGFDVDRNKLRIDLDGYVASYSAPPMCQKVIKARLRDHFHFRGEDGAKDLAKLDRQMEQLDTCFAKLVARNKLTISSFTIPLAQALHAAKGPGESGGKAPGPGEPGPGEPGESDEATRRADDEADSDDAASPASAKDEAREEKADRKKFGSRKAATKEMLDHSGMFEERKLRDGVPEYNGTWLIPRVDMPPLTKLVVRPGTHDYYQSDTGVELRDVARVASDGAVFGRARRRPGTLKRGSVLIDASGSMGLTSEAIESLIQAVPGAVVAVYSARKGASARITVVARNGRMLSDLDRAIEGTGNCCDGPALLWLSRQMMPRIWVCDGQVTDSHDRPDPVLRDECRAIVEAAHITHVKVGPYASELPPVEETLRQLRRARLIK